MTISPSVDLRGAQLPRVRKVPPYSTSAGQEAVELAASAGLSLDPWQAQVLVDALGERPDGKWSAFEVGLVVPRQNGKGAVIEARELAGLFLFDETLILHSAHEYKTASEAFLRMRALIQGTPDLDRRVSKYWQANGEQGIELRSGARLRYVARSKGSGRGFTGDVNILDEAYALTDEQLAALMSTMSSRPNPQIWYTSTPPTESAALLCEVRASDSPRLAYFEWSPPDGYKPTPKDQPATDADREMWVSCNPAFGIRISPEFVEAERGRLSEAGFATERLGEWPPAAGGEWQIISKSAWLARVDTGSRPVDPVAFAVDVTPDRSRAVIGVAGARADGGTHVEVVEYREGTSWVVPRVVELVAKWKPCAVVIDAGSHAGSLIDPLRAAGVDVKCPSVRDIAATCGQFFDAVCGDSPDLFHRDQGPLSAAVAGAQKRPLADMWAWDRKGVSVDVRPLVAVTLAMWGYISREQTTVVPLVAWR